MLKIIQGDCLIKLKELSDNSVDSIVTDPPAGISFMGKSWDSDKGGRDNWIKWMSEVATECKRVLKPGGHAFVWAIPRTSHWTATAWENAGFEIRDVVAHIFGSGFPKSLNVGKQINKLETDEWSKISKAIDNTDQKNIMEVWKTNAKPAGIQLSKSLTEVGSNTPKKYFVPDIAVLYFNQKNELLNAIIAEMRLKGLSLISEENTIIVAENAEQKIELLPDNARYAVKLSGNQNLKSWNIFTAQCDVKEWLNENTEVNHKVDEALKILRGNKKYSNEEITSVLCAELTEILKLTILNQSNTFQSLDTNQKMECASAINVIITEYTAENLISNTVDILKSKAVDKLQGNERKIVGEKRTPDGKTWSERRPNGDITGYVGNGENKKENTQGIETKGTSEWEGWGTALKPAREDWLLMRKPLEKGLNVAENCLKYGTGGINIDESRVGFASEEDKEKNNKSIEAYRAVKTSADNSWKNSSPLEKANPQNQLGRFPANICHDNSEEVRECFPESKSAGEYNKNKLNTFKPDKAMFPLGYQTNAYAGESGNASRFFKSIIYTAKASKLERNRGCEGLKEHQITPYCENGNRREGRDGTGHYLPRQNNHPTVKPIALMEYLVKMITKKGGVVLDPFMGSGSTGVACKQNGFDFIGIELDPEYIKIAEARIKATKVENKLL